MSSKEISINILNREEITFSLELSTTTQEIIEFLVKEFSDYFQNVPIQNIIVKSQNQKILLPNQTLQSILSQEKSKKLNVEIQQQNIQQPQNQFASYYPQQVLDYQKYQGFANFTFNQFPYINNFPQNHQDALSTQSKSQEIYINFIYQSNQINCAIDTSTTLGELLQAMKENLTIPENVSLFYNNNPLLNFKETLEQQNLPNNCTIHIKPFQQQLQICFLYKNQQKIIFIDISKTIDELLDLMQKEFQITEQFSLFYNNRPLLNLRKTLLQLNIPNYSTIEIIKIKQYAFQQLEPQNQRLNFVSSNGQTNGYIDVRVAMQLGPQQRQFFYE